MLHLVAVLLAAAPAAAPSPPPSTARLLVLELEAVSVAPTIARSIDPLVLNAAGGPGVSVIAQSEIKTIASVEAEKAQLGCDSSTCLAELAGALGAQYVLFGSVSRLGSTTTVSLSVYDNTTARVVRDSIDTNDVGALPKELPPRVKALVARARGVPVTTSAAAVPPTPPDDLEPPGALYYAGLGGVIVGGTALVAGGLLAGFNEATIQDPAALAGTKKNAQSTGMAGLVTAGAGVLLTAAGAVALVLE